MSHGSSSHLDSYERKEALIPKHDGYRNLKSFQAAQLVYDATTRFCDRYIEKRCRTHDQMVKQELIARCSRNPSTSSPKTGLAAANFLGSRRALLLQLATSTSCSELISEQKRSLCNSKAHIHKPTHGARL